MPFMKNRPFLPSLVLLSAVLLAPGCEEYYNVDAACHENLVGGAKLDAVERDALLRVNCYRRLSGLTRGTANELLQAAADGEINYVQQNPNLVELISDTGPIWWLTQQFERPGFTGAFLSERLQNAGYTIFDIAGTGFWEYIKIIPAQDAANLPSGQDAIDELMREPLFRQIAMQPSWLDGAYSEAELSEAWFLGDEQAGTGTTGVVENASLIGRVYYMVVMYQAPHFEHVDSPVLLPKEDQVNVPLYSWSTNRNVTEEGGYQPTQLSYPITLLMGSIDPANYKPIEQNQYSATIKNASVVGPDGPLETEVVHPGDEAEDAWPSGRFLRTTLAIYTRAPFEPSTRYTLYADLETPEGEFQVDYSFTTAAEDIGVDPSLGLTPGTTPTGTLSRSSKGGMTMINHYPPGSLHGAPGSLAP
jgi:hypothetical protein